MRQFWLVGLTLGCSCGWIPPAQARAPYGAEYMDQSAFALGKLTLNVVFVESNGAIDRNQEDWTGEQLQQVREQVVLAVDFWERQTAAYHPNARLRINVDYANDGVPLETSFEPITRSGNLGAISNWTNEALNQLTYDGFPVGEASWLNYTSLVKHDSNWATTVFVVNDEVDEDNRFSNGAFAFAVIGGPLVVTTYGNDGWGIDRFHRVLAHELGHTFFALDEYEESRVRNTARSGYLNGVNGNAERDGNGQLVAAPQPNALMLDNTLEMSEFTKVQVGLVDTDGNGVPDILDSPPLLRDIATDVDSDAGWFRFQATAEVTAIPNLNTFNLTLSSSGMPMTINWIAGAEYRLDGGDWIPFAAEDGAFGDYMEGIDILVDGIPRGLHVLDFRTLNSVDIPSDVLSYEFVSNVPEPAGISLALCSAGAFLATLRLGVGHRNPINRHSLPSFRDFRATNVSSVCTLRKFCTATRTLAEMPWFVVCGNLSRFRHFALSRLDGTTSCQGRIAKARNGENAKRQLWLRLNEVKPRWAFRGSSASK